MPIYAYRCTSCGFEKDVMQKVSDPKLTTCPQCNTENFAKQLTAPQFQLKGTGWYATDFKGGGGSTTMVKPETSSEAKAETTPAEKSEPTTADTKSTSTPAPTSTVSTTPSST